MASKRSFKDLVNVVSQSEIPSKSVLSDGFMKQHAMVPYATKLKHVRKQRQLEREKSKGKKWFGLPSTELTEEIKNDLEILKMRSVLDPKRFYKKNETNVLPKYFQVGTIVESSADFYHSRIPKKQRKRTIVDELLADADFTKVKKRFVEQHPEKVSKNQFKGKNTKRFKKKKNKRKK